MMGHLGHIIGSPKRRPMGCFFFSLFFFFFLVWKRMFGGEREAVSIGWGSDSRVSC